MNLDTLIKQAEQILRDLGMDSERSNERSAKTSNQQLMRMEIKFHLNV